MGSPPTQAVAQEVVDSICGIVDDQIILESEVSYGVSTLLLERGMRYPSEAELADIRQQVLDAFVAQKILLSQAQEDTNIVVEERTVTKELENKLQALIAQVGSQQKLEEYFARSIRQIKREMRQGVREGLMVEMLKQRRMGDVHIRRNEVLDFYRQFVDSLPRLPDRVDISHILFPVEPSPEAYDAARERIDLVLNLLDNGADFDSLALVYSDDPSGASGGYLGFTERGDLVPEYEEVAYALKPGSYSGVVESRYGLHVIRLVERQGERISTQHILVKLAPTDEDNRRVEQLAAAVRDSILEGADFGEMARRYSQDDQSADVEGRIKDVALRDLPAEFKLALENLDEGDISQPFKSQFGIHLVRLDARKNARALSLDQEWQQIEQFAVNFKRESLFQEWMQSLKKDHYIWLGVGG